jgi:hypothetical protein
MTYLYYFQKCLNFQQKNSNKKFYGGKYEIFRDIIFCQNENFKNELIIQERCCPSCQATMVGTYTLVDVRLKYTIYINFLTMGLFNWPITNKHFQTFNTLKT